MAPGVHSEVGKLRRVRPRAITAILVATLG